MLAPRKRRVPIFWRAEHATPPGCLFGAASFRTPDAPEPERAPLRRRWGGPSWDGLAGSPLPGEVGGIVAGLGSGLARRGEVGGIVAGLGLAGSPLQGRLGGPLRVLGSRARPSRGGWGDRCGSWARGLAPPGEVGGTVSGSWARSVSPRTATTWSRAVLALQGEADGLPLRLRGSSKGDGPSWSWSRAGGRLWRSRSPARQARRGPDVSGVRRARRGPSPGASGARRACGGSDPGSGARQARRGRSSGRGGLAGGSVCLRKEVRHLIPDDAVAVSSPGFEALLEPCRFRAYPAQPFLRGAAA